MVAQVVLNNKEQNIDKVFDYAVPDGLSGKVSVGVRVSVPFGWGNRRVNGIVVSVSETSDYEKLKEITAVMGNAPACEPEILELCLWVSRKYFCSLYQAIKLATPPGMSSGVREKSIKTATLKLGREAAFGIARALRDKGAVAQAKVLEALLMCETLPFSKLVREKGGTYEAIRALEKKGYITIDAEQIERTVYDEKKFEKTVAYKPTPEQKSVIDHHEKAIEKEQQEKILLRGVTGSGKTEVFLQAIEKVIAKGKNAVMLVNM